VATSCDLADIPPPFHDNMEVHSPHERCNFLVVHNVEFSEKKLEHVKVHDSKKKDL
jgi:hypothetical protein